MNVIVVNTMVNMLPTGIGSMLSNMLVEIATVVTPAGGALYVQTSVQKGLDSGGDCLHPAGP